MTLHNPEQHTNQKTILFAAGSLSQAFKDVAQAVQAEQGIVLEIECGATARMAKLIAEGAPCDLFAAADMQTPQKFADAGKAAAVIPFIRNDTVAVSRKNMGITSTTLRQFLATASPASIGISDPATQPCGANARQALAHVLSDDLLNRAVHIVTGGLDKKREKAPDEKSDYTVALEQDVDLLLVFRTTAQKICAQSEQAAVIELPDSMRVTADYGMILLNDKAATRAIADYLQSQKAKHIFQKHGFQ